MRVRKISALAVIVAAAGLSLTACGGSGGSSTAAQSSTPASASNSAGGQGTTGASSSDTSGSTGTSTSGSTGKKAARTGTTASGAMCRTEHLGFSAASAGVKNEIVVNLKNTGSATCSMHGFPGVQLLGADGLGDKGPDAARTDTTAPTVTIAPGEETRFLLHYIPDTSGSGKTYTKLSVTPPNETVFDVMNLDGLDITIPATTGNAPDVYVDPIGYHTGTGK
ncbi:DUF4232 domain-containing protein [Streptomyces sp. SID4946]|uniref:DUF4232 domain-containing protein n=1 Tax=Streptomyces sp. LamerLS-31b TaxID=1839765 RepID=UPI00081E1348|nr:MULTISPECIES: DUF4232 domain-containing protein [unclassified Streptomyces]MYQ93574.1 DUF4232 domain-containing protein [Streptomyces sp. SID4946]SCF82921.1 Protein of unknown function [Streptomyces sp. DconLS]SCF92348.1 Protein of unknown function [Streptomyces sp. LamerLS-31b]